MRGQAAVAAVAALVALGASPASAATYLIWSMYTDSSCFTTSWPTSIFVYERTDCADFVTTCTMSYNSSAYYYEAECSDDYETALANKLPVGSNYLLESHYDSDSGCFNWYGIIAYPLDGLCHPATSDGGSSAITTIYSDESVSLVYYPDATCSSTSEYTWQQDVSAANAQSGDCQQASPSENSTAVFYNTYKIVSIVEGSSSSAGSDSSSGSDDGGGLSTGVLIGIIAGAVVLVIVVAVIIFCCCCRKKRNADDRAGVLEAAPTPNKGFEPSHDGQYYGMHNQQPNPSMTAGSSEPYWSGQNPHVRESNAATNSSGGLWDDDVIVAARIPRDRVMFEGLLSRGGYGEVHVGTYNGERVAIKTLLPERRKQIRHVNDFLAEVKMMAGLDHPRIVQFIGVAWDSLANLCVVSEFMSGGDLRVLLQQYEASNHPQGFDYTKVKIAMHIAHALTYLHSLQPLIIHRDLKSRNVLLDGELNAKLTDFGVSRERVDATMTAGVGTSLWMAPEIMMGEKYDDKADVFSFGVMLSEIDLHGLPYANAKDSTGTGRKMPDTAILQLVTLGKLRVEFSAGAMADVVELGYSCVEVDPKKRPTSAEVLYKLHSILRNWS